MLNGRYTEQECNEIALRVPNNMVLYRTFNNGDIVKNETLSNDQLDKNFLFLKSNDIYAVDKFVDEFLLIFRKRDCSDIVVDFKGEILNGFKGLTGTPGGVGDLGNDGLLGSTGLTGLVGLLINGGIGDTGLTGNLGITGIDGSIGNKGIEGFGDLIGETGGIGIDGIKGSPISYFSKNGITNHTHKYVDSKFNENGVITFNITDNGLETGNQIFDTISFVNALTFFNGVDGTNQVINSGVRIINNKTIEIHALDGVELFLSPTSTQNTIKLSNNTGALVTIEVVGVLSIFSRSLLSNSNPMIGPIGSVGLRGTNGSIGTVGLNGPIGLNGVIGGVGVNGLLGLQGLSGTTGSIGNFGNRGNDGGLGNSGLVGLLGINGNAGSVGQNGLSGATGLIGGAGKQGMSQIFFNETGIINNIGEFIIVVNNESDGRTPINVTLDGTPNGVPIFDNILAVVSTSFLTTINSVDVPIANGFSVVNNKEVNISVINGKTQALTLGSNIETVDFSSNTNIKIHVRVLGILSQVAKDTIALNSAFSGVKGPTGDVNNNGNIGATGVAGNADSTLIPYGTKLKTNFNDVIPTNTDFIIPFNVVEYDELDYINNKITSTGWYEINLAIGINNFPENNTSIDYKIYVLDKNNLIKDIEEFKVRRDNGGLVTLGEEYSESIFLLKFLKFGDSVVVELNYKHYLLDTVAPFDGFITASGFNGEVKVITSQPDGKILVGGGFTSYRGLAANRLIRLNSDGTKDISFSVGSGFDSGVRSIAIQPDGKILVGGTFTEYNNGLVNFIIRLNNDGTVDQTFFTGRAFNIGVNIVVLQSDGKVLVGGAFTSYDGFNANRIIRLETDGSIDNSFITGTGFNSQVISIVVQPNGKILLGGIFTSYQGIQKNRIARLNSNGSYDLSFFDSFGFNNPINSLALQSDGKILAGGSFINKIVRLNTNGVPDATFIVTSGFNDDVHSIIIQPDGKVLVGGAFTTYEGAVSNRIIRLNNNGIKDNTFIVGSGFDDAVKSILLYSNDKILVGGLFTTYKNDAHNRIIMFNNSGLVINLPNALLNNLLLITNPVFNNLTKLSIQKYSQGINGDTGSTLLTISGSFNENGEETIVFNTSDNSFSTTTTDITGEPGPFGDPGLDAITINDITTNNNGDGTFDVTFNKTNGDSIVNVVNVYDKFQMSFPETEIFEDGAVYIWDYNLIKNGLIIANIDFPLEIQNMEDGDYGVIRIINNTFNDIFVTTPNNFNFSNGETSLMIPFDKEVIIGVTYRSINTTSPTFFLNKKNIPISTFYIKKSNRPQNLQSSDISDTSYLFVESQGPDTSIIKGGIKNVFNRYDEFIFELTEDDIRFHTFSLTKDGNFVITFGNNFIRIYDLGGNLVNALVVPFSALNNNFFISENRLLVNLVDNIGIYDISDVFNVQDPLIIFDTSLLDGPVFDFALSKDNNKLFILTENSNDFILYENLFSGVEYITTEIVTQYRSTQSLTTTGNICSNVSGNEVLLPWCDANLSEKHTIALFRKVGLVWSQVNTINESNSIDNNSFGYPFIVRSDSNLANVFASSPSYNEGGLISTGRVYHFSGSVIENINNGGIDTSFVIGTGFNSEVYTIAIQPDGKILVGGQFTTYNDVISNYIIRLNSDGSRDISFVIGTGFNIIVYTTSIQSNGKILVGGQFTTYNGVTSSRIIRLNSDGSRDTSFVIGTGFNNIVRSIITQSDGKILVGGQFTLYNGVPSSRIIRLNVDGSIDTSFIIGDGFDDLILSIVTQLDGKILVGGQFTTYNGVVSNRIIRLNSDGSIDNSFVIGGGFVILVRTISLQSNGKIIVGGDFTSYNGVTSNRIIRLNSDGSIDNSFVIGTGFNIIVYTTSIQSNGKILVGGQFTTYNGVTSSRIIRLNSDGSRDTSFVIGTGFNNIVRSIITQSDGKILVGGQFTLYNGVVSNRIIRLNSTTSFSTSDGHSIKNIYRDVQKINLNPIYFGANSNFGKYISLNKSSNELLIFRDSILPYELLLLYRIKNE